MKKRGKIYIIGLDGASYPMINFWMERGHMPNLKKLMQQGISGDLMSCEPPMTGPAWNTFSTGCNPGKHSIYDFMTITKRPGKYSMINSRNRMRRSIWNYLNEAGIEVSFQNMPTTYPPEKIDGVMVAGMLTPGSRKNFGKPRELFKEIEKKFGPYPLYYKSPMYILNLNENLVNSFIDEAIQLTAQKQNKEQPLLL